MADSPPALDPGQGSINLLPITSPWSALWWVSQWITNIPADSVGWLVAQGWQIYNISYDQTTVPPTPYYDMSRDSLQNAIILQHLLNSYTIAYNDARAVNDFRYNQIVANWTEASNTSQTYFGTQSDEHNSHIALYLGNLDTYMDDIEELVEANRTQIVADAAIATAALTAMDTKLADLETNADTNATTIGALLTAQAGYLTTFLSDYGTKRDELDTNYTAHLALIEALLTDADTDLTSFAATQAAELSALEAAYYAHVSELDGLLLQAETYLDTVATDINQVLTDAQADYTALEPEIETLIDSGETDFSSYETNHNSLMDLLKSDYDSHASTATAFLDNLGVTDLARIEEKYTASLSEQVQILTDQGMYSSGRIIDLTARKNRDESEEIGLLNDRLNRERWENQHRLYEQQVGMRNITLAGLNHLHGVRQELYHYHVAQVTNLYQLLQVLRDRTLNAKTTLYSLREANVRLNIEVKSRLYDIVHKIQQLLVEEAARLHQLQQAITQWKNTTRDRLLELLQGIVHDHLTGLEKEHAAQQEVSRVAMAERDVLFGQLQDAVKGFIAGKERYSDLTMQQASTLADHKHKAIVEKMNEYVTRLEGLRGTHEETMKLMAYQLDERNKLLVGLYGFVERREDIGPSFKDLSTVCTSLGDAGGGWITP